MLTVLLFISDRVYVSILQNINIHIIEMMFFYLWLLSNISFLGIHTLYICWNIRTLLISVGNG